VAEHLPDRQQRIPLVGQPEVGQILDHGRIERQFASLSQLHQRRRHERL
jgi:hypothetical protein